MKISRVLAAGLALSTFALAAAPAVAVKGAVAGAAKPGKAFVVNLMFSIPEGYHIYGPKDPNGIATKIALVGPKGFTGTVMYPKTIPFKGIDGSEEATYNGDTTIPVKVVGTKSLKGKQTLHFKVTSQACNDRTCLPPTTSDIAVVATIK